MSNESRQESERENFKTLDKEKNRSKSQLRSQKKVEPKSSNFCANCGSKNERNALFCEECGADLNQKGCKRCGAELLPGADICEACGEYQLAECCSFCGGAMDADDDFCPECGSPSEGIECPNCGTLSVFDFCPSCNYAITDRAKAELKAAHEDPKFKKVAALEEELAVLKQEAQKAIDAAVIERQQIKEQEQKAAAERAKPVEPKPNRKTAFNKLSFLNDSSDEPATDPTPVPEPEVVREPVYQPPAEMLSLEELEQQFKDQIAAKAEELQGALTEMCETCEFSSPQASRNYFSSRKPQKANYVWKCRFESSIHPDPQNCGKPQMGGKWIIYEGDIEWVPHYGDA